MRFLRVREFFKSTNPIISLNCYCALCCVTVCVSLFLLLFVLILLQTTNNKNRISKKYALLELCLARSLTSLSFPLSLSSCPMLAKCILCMHTCVHLYASLSLSLATWTNDVVGACVCVCVLGVTNFNSKNNNNNTSCSLYALLSI